MPGTVIRRYREMKNFSQTYVAGKMGISQNAYSKIENNLTQLTVHHVKQLSEILQTPVVDLLRDDFEIHKSSVLNNKSTSKDEVVKMLDHIKTKLQAKHTANHETYFVSMSLLSSVNNLVSHIY